MRDRLVKISFIFLFPLLFSCKPKETSLSFIKKIHVEEVKGEWALCIWEPEKNEIKRIFTYPQAIYFLDFSSTGQLLFVTRKAKKEDKCGIWIINKDGSGLRNVFMSNKDIIGAQWLRGEKCVSFMEERDLYILDLESGELKKIFQLDENIMDCSYFSWSPDEKRIAFCIFKEGREYLYIIEAERKEAILSISNVWSAILGRSLLQSWSPKGDKIALALLDGRLYELDIKNKKLIPIIKDEKTLPFIINPYMCIWSQDGKAIIFHARTSSLIHKTEKDYHHIYKIDLETKKLHPLLSLEDSEEIQQVDQIDFSPDGSKMAFVTRDIKGLWSIWIKDMKKGELFKLEKEIYKSYDSPTWSKDGKLLAFVAFTIHSFTLKEEP